jgi:uncharacterized Zn-finger protein
LFDLGSDGTVGGRSVGSTAYSVINLPLSAATGIKQENVLPLQYKTATSAKINENVISVSVEGLNYKRSMCKICGKVFSQKGTAIRHVKSIHFLQKRVYCPNCNSGFKHKFHLKNHMEMSCKKS